MALRGGALAGQLATGDAEALARWCRAVVGRKGIICFASPTRQVAVAHPSHYYGWMLRGEALFQALEPSHPLAGALPIGDRRCGFETFPHTITWHLRGGDANATQKRRQRRELLQQAGLDLARLTSIDWIDAALCALTAQHAASGGECVAYGEPDTGWIVVPGRRKLWR